MILLQIFRILEQYKEAIYMAHSCEKYTTDSHPI